MKRYNITFGQNHPLRNGYCTIIAPNYEIAREEVFAVFGNKFAFIRETNVEMDKEYFPAGQFGEVIDLSHEKI